VETEQDTAGQEVGFVGLGNMGIPMTGRLVAAGYHVRGYDTSAEALRMFAAIGGGDADDCVDGGRSGIGTGGVGRSPDRPLPSRIGWLSYTISLAGWVSLSGCSRSGRPRMSR